MVKIINLIIVMAAMLGLYKLYRRLDEEGLLTGNGGNGQLAPQDAYQEAYKVLGIAEGASRDEIVSAHIRLMKKFHPDQQGSEWLAKKINAAKDLLLKG